MTRARWPGRATLGVAARMIVRRPARSLLAALGVALAIGALIVAESVAERGRLRTLAEIREMGATVLVVSAEESRNRGARARTGAEVRTLTMRDERDIQSLVPDIAGTAAEYRTNVPIKVGDLGRVATIAGIDPDYARIRGAPIAAGRFFTNEEDAQGTRVAVIGGQLARDLFAADEGDGAATTPLGRPFRIRGVPFSVIGVLPPRGTGLDAFDEDNAVFIPLKTARRRLFQVDYVHRIFVRVGQDRSLGRAAAAIVALLRQRHHAAGNEPLDFRVQDQRRLVNLQVVAARNLMIFQRVVAGALLGASGLGVLALQILAVRERRVEIGTRRALGASRPTIFLQFVLESSVVTMAGAIVGLAGALAVSPLIDLRVSLLAGVVDCAACVAAAVMAAAAPAWRAASLGPSVVLRQG